MNDSDNDNKNQLNPPRPKHLFQKGQSGNPLGRPRKEDTFTRNAVMEMCQKLNCNPIEILARFANGDSEGLQLPPLFDKNGLVLTDPDGNVIREAVPQKHRLSSAIELAGYLTPKLRSVEVNPGVGSGGEEKNKPRLLLLMPSNGREVGVITNSPTTTLIDNDTGEVYHEVELDSKPMDMDSALYDDDQS